LDLNPIEPDQRVMLANEIDADWIKKDLEEAALSHVSDKLVPEHFEEIREPPGSPMSTNITQADLIESIAAALQYIS